MKIISYNVNGIRAAVKKGFLDWLKEENPDVLCLQETKAQPDQIPILDFTLLGYQTYVFSAQKKGYSGVAILTKSEPDNVLAGMGIREYDDEGRMIRIDIGDLSIISVYHPSGSSGDVRQAFKMKWLSDFQSYIEELRLHRKKLIVAGDYNICHQAIDIHDPVRNAKNSGFLPEERAWMSGFLQLGYVDTFRFLHPESKDAYSWWSYRANARNNNKGWRIDYIMTTDNLKKNISESGILPEVKHSDHCPVYLKLK
jgi:exodeoxyribonuclease-3